LPSVRWSEIFHHAVLGRYDTPGRAEAVVVAGNLAYVADGSVGLQVIDVSNPMAPVRVGGYDTGGDALDVAVAGGIAYVADGGGLEIIDVSIPAAPVRLGGYDAENSAQGIAVAGNIAYLTDNISGLQIIDVSNPASPVWLGEYHSPDYLYLPFKVTVADGIAYLAAGVICGGIEAGLDCGGLQIIDVSNPALPTLLGKYDDSDTNDLGVCNDVAIAGSTVYLSCGVLSVIDVSNPNKPIEIENSGGRLWRDGCRRYRLCCARFIRC